MSKSVLDKIIIILSITLIFTLCIAGYSNGVSVIVSLSLAFVLCIEEYVNGKIWIAMVKTAVFIGGVLLILFT